MAKTIRIRLAQMSPKLGKVRDNLQTVVRESRAAKKAGADIVVFPELALTGYFLKDLVPEVALRQDSPEMKSLAAASKGLGLVVGGVEESPDHRFFNSAFYFENGRLRGRHRKVYLPTYGLFDEGRDLAWGDRVEPLPSRFGPLGIMICEDAWHPSLAYLLALQGAELFIVPSCSPARGFPKGVHQASSVRRWQAFGAAHAAFLTTPLVYCNRVGFEEGVGFGGGSFAVDAEGKSLLAPRPRSAGFWDLRLNPAGTRAVRASTPLLRDERAALVAEELRRIRAGREA